MLPILNFIAVDFETANQNRASICQAAAVRVVNGEIAEYKEWYVKPKDDYFSPINTYIHGITFDKVKDSPEFCDIWEELKDMIAGGVVVAHNVGFDIYALRDVLREYNIELPVFKFFCTLSYCKKIMTLEKYSLINVCKKLGVEFENHHNAKFDAIACATIALKFGVDDYHCRSFPADLVREKEHTPAPMADLSGIEIFDLSSTITVDTLKNKSVVVTGVFLDITREEVENYVIETGANLTKAISKKTALVVMGQCAGPAKIEKVKALNKECFIPIIDEKEFMETMQALGIV